VGVRKALEMAFDSPDAAQSRGGREDCSSSLHPATLIQRVLCSQSARGRRPGGSTLGADRRRLVNRGMQRMNSVQSLLLLVLLAPSVASAAQIYGGLREGDRQVGQGIEVQVTCGNAAPYSGVTDSYGSYSISVRQTGSCMLMVRYSGTWTSPFQVYSEDAPVRYDFVLLRQRDGSIALQRR
jgi:hypothetical protein